MPRGRPTQAVIVSDEDREILERWERRPNSAQALALRARVVLACEIGLTNTEVSQLLNVTMPTVGKWRSRFIQYGPDGLTDEPRPGAPRTISDDDVEKVVTLTLETTPEDATHWSTRSMARRSGMTQSAVSRIWRAFALQPHRAETFKLSKGPAVH
jgi:transposase